MLSKNTLFFNIKISETKQFNLKQSIGVYSLIKYERFTYKDYVYPWWGEVLGWCMAFSSMLAIPVYALYKIITNKGTLKEVIILLKALKTDQH